MTPQERIDSHRTARVMRAARKSRGMSQLDFGRKLGISQAAVSKLESGRLMPSSSHWFQFCRDFEIPAVFSFETGFIDYCRSVDMFADDSVHAFKMPRKYTRHARSTVRSTLPFLRFFERELGSDKLKEYLRYKKIDPDFFTIYDNRISLKFAIDIILELVAQGLLTHETMKSVARLVSRNDGHGMVVNRYQSINRQKDLVRRRVELMDLYEANCAYKLIEEDNHSFVLSCRPNPLTRHINIKHPVFGPAFHEYKRVYLEEFSTMNGQFHAQTQSIQSYFEGADECLYRIHFAG